VIEVFVRGEQHDLGFSNGQVFPLENAEDRIDGYAVFIDDGF
jgi:hypothetical protein